MQHAWGETPWLPPGRARLYTQRTGAGLASGPGDPRTPKTDIRGCPPRPLARQKGTILYLTRREPRLDGSAWGVGAVPGSLPCSPPVPSLWHLLGDAQSRTVRCPLRILRGRSEMPGVPAGRIPASAPPRAATHPGSLAWRACLPGGWLSAQQRRLLRFSSAAATSLGAPCFRSPRAHAGQLLRAG